MPAFTMTKTYNDGDVLNESDLDGMKSSTETFLNTTKIDSDNIQTGGIATANLADLAVTVAKLGAEAVETAKIKDLNVTAAKIATGVITQVKMGSVGQQASASSGSVTAAYATQADITNLTVTITTTGRPVMILCQHDGAGAGPAKFSIEITSGSSTQMGYNIILQRGGSDLAQYQILMDANYTSGRIMVPSSCIQYLDTPAAGTYTYKIQALRSGVATTSLNTVFTKLVAYEL